MTIYEDINNAYWTPTQEDLDALNVIRAKNGLNPVLARDIATRRDWLNACHENDLIAEGLDES